MTVRNKNSINPETSQRDTNQTLQDGMPACEHQFSRAEKAEAKLPAGVGGAKLGVQWMLVSAAEF